MDDKNEHLLAGSPLQLSYGLGDDIFDTNTYDNDQPTGGKSMWKAWTLLIIAILLEVAGTTSMKLSEGFSNILPSILIYVFYAASFTVLPLSLEVIELSTAYAVWSGLGTCCTALIGFVWFKDTVNWIKIAALIAIISGCVVIKFADKAEEAEDKVGGER